MAYGALAFKNKTNGVAGYDTLASVIHPAPVNLPLGSAVYSERFQDLSGMDTTSGNSAKAADETNYSTGTQGMKLTGLGDGTSIRVDQTVAQNMSTVYRMLFEFYLPPDEYDEHKSVEIYLQSGSSWSNYALANLWVKATDGNGAFSGWQSVGLCRSQFTEVGAFDWADVTAIRWRWSPEASTSESNMTYGLARWDTKPTEKGQVTISFDDGYASHFPGALYCLDNGLAPTLFVIPSLVGTTSDYITWDQLRILKQRGAFIALHSDGSTTWDDWSLSTRLDTLESERTILVRNGFGEGARVFATPGGHYDQTDDQYILGSRVDAIRVTKKAQWREGPAPVYQRRLWGVTEFDNNTTATLEGHMNNAAADHGNVHFAWHLFGTYASNQTAFEAAIDEVVAELASHSADLESKRFDEQILGI